jgi:cold shock CspA family protein
MRAYIISVQAERGFAFAEATPEAPSAGRVFVHQSACDFQVADLKVGDLVEIAFVELSTKGPRAVGVSFVERPGLDQVEATVTRVCRDRGFCFAKADDGEDCYLHVRAFTDFRGERSASFEELVPQARVRFQRVPVASGKPRGDAIEVI